MSTEYPNGRGIKPVNPVKLALEGIDVACKGQPFPTLCMVQEEREEYGMPKMYSPWDDRLMKLSVCTAQVNHHMVGDVNPNAAAIREHHYETLMVAVLRDRRNQIVDAFRKPLSRLRREEKYTRVGEQGDDEFFAELDRMQRLTTCIDIAISRHGGEV